MNAPIPAWKLLPSWADPAHFAEVEPGAFIRIRERKGTPHAVIAYKRKRIWVEVGAARPWVAVRAYLRHLEQKRVVTGIKRMRVKRADRRRRSQVTYEYLYAKLDLARRRAARKGIAFELTVADLYEFGDRQRWTCALTGAPFDCTNREAWNNPYSLAIDRVDSKAGYTRENVRLVLHAINVALGPWGEDVYREIATLYFRAHRWNRRGPAVDRVKVISSNPEGVAVLENKRKFNGFS